MIEPGDAWPVVQRAILAFGATVPDMIEVRKALADVLETSAWQHYRSPLGREWEAAAFAEWVERRPPGGLGTTVPNLREMAEGDTGLLAKIEEAADGGELRRKGTETGRGLPNRSNNITSIRGDRASYVLRRLKRDRPDLAQRVIDGKLSPHAAAVKAGFRKPTFTVPKAGPERIAQYLRRHLDDDTLRAVSKLLDQDGT